MLLAICEHNFKKKIVERKILVSIYILTGAEILRLNSSTDKYQHAQYSVGWNCLSCIPKLQRLHRSSLGVRINFIPYFIMDVITYPSWDITLTMNNDHATEQGIVDKK